MTFSAFYARNGVEKQVFNGKFGDGLCLTGQQCPLKVASLDLCPLWSC